MRPERQRVTISFGAQRAGTIHDQQSLFHQQIVSHNSYCTTMAQQLDDGDYQVYEQQKKFDIHEEPNIFRDRIRIAEFYRLYKADFVREAPILIIMFCYLQYIRVKWTVN